MSKYVTLTIDPESELGRAVTDPEVEEVSLQVGPRKFNVIEDEKSAYWATTTFSEHAAKFQGIFEGIDADQLVEDIYRWRREGSWEAFEE